MSPLFFHKLSWSLLLLQCAIILVAYLWGLVKSGSNKLEADKQFALLVFQLLPWLLLLLFTIYYPLKWPWSLIKASLYFLTVVAMLGAGLWRDAYLISDAKVYGAAASSTLYTFLILSGFICLFEAILQFANSF